MINSYEAGSVVRVSAAFTSFLTGSLIDPDVVNLSVRNGAGVVTTYTYLVATIVRDSTGNYHVDLDTTGNPGVWYYRWFSTGNGQAAAEQSFQVAKPVAA